MGIGYKVHNQKAKLNEDTNDDTFGPMQKPGTSEEHNSRTSHFNVIKKRDHRTRMQGNI